MIIRVSLRPGTSSPLKASVSHWERRFTALMSCLGILGLGFSQGIRTWEFRVLGV